MAIAVVALHLPGFILDNIVLCARLWKRRSSLYLSPVSTVSCGLLCNEDCLALLKQARLKILSLTGVSKKLCNCFLWLLNFYNVSIIFPQPSPINSLSHSDQHNPRDSQLPAGFQKSTERIMSSSATNKVQITFQCIRAVTKSQ